MKTLLYNPDGTPAVVDVGPEDRMRLLLVEVFGLLVGYNSAPETHYRGKSPMPLGARDVLQIIVDICGEKLIEERFEGIKLEVVRRPHAAGRES